MKWRIIPRGAGLYHFGADGRGFPRLSGARAQKALKDICARTMGYGGLMGLPIDRFRTEGGYCLFAIAGVFRGFFS